MRQGTMDDGQAGEELHPSELASARVCAWSTPNRGWQSCDWLAHTLSVASTSYACEQTEPE